MVSEESTQVAAYELPLPQEPSAKSQFKGTEEPLPESLLVQNVLWFCRFRWLIIAGLFCYGILGLSPGLLGYLGIRPPGVWPFVIASILVLSNLTFLLLAWHGLPGGTGLKPVNSRPGWPCHKFTARMAVPHKASAARTVYNLWGQIVTDLVVLTAVVYFVGSLETNIAFAYLFHIVLSCVFFSHRQSLIVVLIAMSLFAASIVAEYVLKILPPMSIFAESLQGQGVAPALTLNFFFIIGIWLVVWYLASHLSSIVRRRDFELGEANRRLITAQEERSRHILATTHQLKAPFAAVYSNAQLLLEGYCGDIPDEALQVIQKITSRCRRLTTEIQEMLQLANLTSASQQTLAKTKMVSTELLLWCISQVGPVARQRGIDFKVNIQPVHMVGAEDHFKMLFVNLLSNAVNYSYQNGQVHVSCYRGPSSEPVVTIIDHGIGIPADKLPHIFEAHYRTKEAVRYNKESSGLGLTIVKQVAEMYGIRIRVESRPGFGTKFELKFSTPDISGLEK